ncbi:cytochrome P450 [Ferribacterium limneticum]|uniref:cytochrome P450 n=1 Tax=Ferribacterium limneticum TaxID=76259 RepID=UPI001CF894DA|nr:cytochrome P450 [Ferribacterium limneticum]UCV23650.1 cytochrome P450 [Ferribacterium limneticum]
MTSTNFPAHVPAELVRGFNYYDLGDGKDLYEHYKKLHSGPDIFYTPEFGGHWVLTRYEDIAHLLENDKDFSSRHQTIPYPPFLVTLLENDEPLHSDFRNLLQPFFTPKSIGALEQVATDLTVSLIEGLVDKGECEFTQEFALRMPIIIVMNVLDLPSEDTPYLIQISEDMVRSADPKVQEAAFGRVFEYFATKIIPARRANPGKDMVSAIIHGKVDGGRVPTDMEILGLCSLLIAGGLDTVASMLGFITVFLANNPEHRQQLIDNPALIPSAMEEMFRRHHITNIGRIAVRDIDYKGIHFKAGDFILAITALAGLDERRYPDPLTVDFNREDKKHLVFGRGPHQCIGSFLARTEIRVFLNEWLKRIPHFEIKAGESPLVIPGKANRVARLPLTWKTL